VDASWNTPPGVRWPRWVHGVVERLGMRYLMHGPSYRSWFLRDRVLNWRGGPRVRMVLVGPPLSMMCGGDVVSLALRLDLRCYPATGLESVPQLSYLDNFARHRLLGRLPLDEVPVVQDRQAAAGPRISIILLVFSCFWVFSVFLSSFLVFSQGGARHGSRSFCARVDGPGSPSRVPFGR